jgi:hypothetical protein
MNYRFMVSLVSLPPQISRDEACYEQHLLIVGQQPTKVIRTSVDLN